MDGHLDDFQAAMSNVLRKLDRVVGPFTRGTQLRLHSGLISSAVLRQSSRLPFLAPHRAYEDRDQDGRALGPTAAAGSVSRRLSPPGRE